MLLHEQTKLHKLFKRSFFFHSSRSSWNSRASLMIYGHIIRQNTYVYIQEISRSQLVRAWATFHLLKDHLRVKGKTNEDDLIYH